MPELTFIIANSDFEFSEAKRIRHEVFVLEQGIPEELDSDGDDNRSVHLLASGQRGIIGIGRLTINGSAGVLSRICVLKKFRKGGIGKLIVQELERIAKQNRLTKLTLCPHEFLETFYNSLGYKNDFDDKIVGPYKLLTMSKRL